MKLSNAKIIGCIASFIMLFAYSCRKEYYDNSSENNLNIDLTIEEAKSYYYKELKSTKIQKLASNNQHIHDENCDHENEEQLMWDGFKYRELIGGSQAVLTPIHREGVYIKVGENKMVKYGFLNYVMMYKDSSDNIITEKVSLKPSLKWLESKGKRAYDGSILVRHWDGRVKAIYHFTDGTTKSNKKLATSYTNRSENNAEDPPCFVTTTYTLKPATCPCAGHTYAQRESCTCHTKPSNGYGTLIVEVEIDCPPSPVDDPPTRTGGGSGGGGYPPPGNNGGGGSSEGNYTPLDCTPDGEIDYSIPLKSGEVYAIPCSQVALPVEDPNTITVTKSSTSEILSNIFKDLTTQEKITIKLNDEKLANQILNNIIEGSEDSHALNRWAIAEITKGTLTWEEFENWFMGTPEYTGGEDEVNEDNITFEDIVVQTSLPSLSTFKTNFPKIEKNGKYTQMEATDVYKLIGGSPYINHKAGNKNYTNACAIRGSKALLYSGIHIPVIKEGGNQRTEKGDDKKNYILDAVSFDKFMRKKFGSITHELTGEDANNKEKVAKLLKDKNGIYVIINKDGTSTGAGYSGHVDLILDGKCIGGAYTTPKGGVKSIRIWILK